MLEAALRGVVERHLAILCERLGDERRRELLALAQYAAGNLLASGSLTPARRSALEACLDCTSLSPDAACLPVWRAAATLLFTQKNECMRASMSGRDSRRQTQR